jgi:hypothetical protein
MPHPSLLGSPYEVLRSIVLFAVGSSQLGPPKEYHSLALTCRSLNARLSFNADPTLHSDILSQKFDRGALDRPFGQSVIDHVGVELPRRFMALKCIRRGCLDDPALLDALYVAFILFLENDGRNVVQLQWAGLHSIVHRYLREKMSMGSETNDGWPLDNEINTLVVTLAWLVTTRGESFMSQLTFSFFPLFSSFDQPQWKMNLTTTASRSCARSRRSFTQHFRSVVITTFFNHEHLTILFSTLAQCCSKIYSRLN